MVTITMKPIKRVKRKTGVRMFQTGHSPMVTQKAPKQKEPVATGMAAGYLLSQSSESTFFMKLK